MVAYCYVEGCKTTKYKNKIENNKALPMYGFPSNVMLREKWINAVLSNQINAENPPKYSRICIKHFADDQLEQFGFMGVRLKKNAVPTLFPNVK
ncbi:hypothetical protein DMN91_004918 [Ooceraea biroi]|uniref:THAP-type domain-containing protein n=1 Tax=Ooceraea biroi TaxID=2015173 RepID=A0A026WC10_OOCBI|nr:hypothetical protein X777_07023 [Ooceraea biroi]RLU22640.1 hypothetical protein DMN91_004918 [Ooceraea biroi]